MTENLVIRPIDPERDLEQLLPLFELVFGNPLSREEWEWKYLLPWSERTFAIVGYIGDRLLGHVGAVPVPGIKHGRETLFFQLGDLMIHPDHRGSMKAVLEGAKSFLDEISASHPEHVLYGFSKHDALLWFRRLGFPDLVEKAETLIVRPGAGEREGLEVEPWSWDSPEIDQIWERLKPTIRLGLIRDGRYLRWRYEARPFYKYRLYGVRSGGDAAGWLVVRASDKELQGPREELSVVDLLVEPSMTPAAVEAVARHIGARSLALWLPSRLSAAFQESRESGVNVMHGSSANPMPLAELRRDLYYTMGDADWN